MCQLCTITDIASCDRWPKPLEQHKSDVDFLVSAAHDECTSSLTNEQKRCIPRPPTSPALLDQLRLLARLLEQVEQDRQMWWRTPEKREQRRRLEEDCD